MARNTEHTAACISVFEAVGATELSNACLKFTIAQLEVIAACPDISHHAMRIAMPLQRALRADEARR